MPGANCGINRGRKLKGGTHGRRQRYALWHDRHNRRRLQTLVAAGRDRGSPVSHYDAPFEFTGRLLRVTVAMHNDQTLDGDGVSSAEMARQ
jgi:hypothetical protein